MRLAGHVARKGQLRNAYKILIGKSEGKRPLGRPRHKWEVNINMYLWKIEFGVWIEFVWLRIWTGRGYL
jgi:hypothetical protein